MAAIRPTTTLTEGIFPEPNPVAYETTFRYPGTKTSQRPPCMQINATFQLAAPFGQKIHSSLISTPGFSSIMHTSVLLLRHERPGWAGRHAKFRQWLAFYLSPRTSNSSRPPSHSLLPKSNPFVHEYKFPISISTWTGKYCQCQCYLPGLHHRVCNPTSSTRRIEHRI